MNCYICGETENLKHLSVYASGSEGVELCHSCEMELLYTIKLRRRIFGQGHKHGWLASTNYHGASQKARES